jgi:hypothetical protein
VLSDKPKKYPDEDEIEKILNKVHDIAWNNLTVSDEEESKLATDFKWILEIWSKKYLGHDRLTQAINKNYLSTLPLSQDKLGIYKELDLVICFFQHYIYAFEEFMTREFRDSVIRCGLVSERLVNRLAVADEHPEVLQIKNFEDRANRMMSSLSDRIDDIHFLINRMKYIYSQRTRKGAHDTGAAGILIAKSCISEIPIAYMEYLNALEKIGYKITSRDELITLVNETVKVGTTMIVVEIGEPVKPEQILVSMYSQNYFAAERAFSEIRGALAKQGHNYPDATLWNALNDLRKKKMISRIRRGAYIQRTPPEKYFSKEIVD